MRQGAQLPTTFPLLHPHDYPTPPIIESHRLCGSDPMAILVAQQCQKRHKCDASIPILTRTGSLSNILQISGSLTGAAANLVGQTVKLLGVATIKSATCKKGVKILFSSICSQYFTPVNPSKPISGAGGSLFQLGSLPVPRYISIYYPQCNLIFFAFFLSQISAMNQCSSGLHFGFCLI
jgi:hypothetical protein